MSNQGLYGFPRGLGLVGGKFGFPSINSSFDADATVVIMAIEVTGVTLSQIQKDAINTRIVNAKNNGVWTKWIAYYGYVGGTAASHAINWKNPSSYAITWNGNITHNANGVKGDGATGYGDTGLPMSSFTFGSVGLGFYATDIIPNEAKYQMGAGLTSSSRMDLIVFNSVNYFNVGTDASYVIGSSNDRAKQYFSGNLLGATGKIYKNGSDINSGALISASFANRNIWILATNRNDGTFNSATRLGSTVLNTGLTNAEEAANYISELAFQTALSRN